MTHGLRGRGEEALHHVDEHGEPRGHVEVRVEQPLDLQPVHDREDQRGEGRGVGVRAELAAVLTALDRPGRAVPQRRVPVREERPGGVLVGEKVTLEFEVSAIRNSDAS